MASARSMEKRLSYVECRLYGHAWERFNPRSNSAAMKGYGLTLRCTRCHTERYDSWGRTGELDGRRYVHPDDYKIAREDTPDRPNLRLLFAKMEHITYRRNPGSSERAGGARPRSASRPKASKGLRAVS